MLYRAGVADEAETQKIQMLGKEGLTDWQIARRTGVHPREIREVLAKVGLR